MDPRTPVIPAPEVKCENHGGSHPAQAICRIYGGVKPLPPRCKGRAGDAAGQPNNYSASAHPEPGALPYPALPPPHRAAPPPP
ncbi:hypothetical protein CYMTET_33154 [Cymbomonas tetramitiformis]|uniref:Uncharacterized protein n=1 Tax=Cymbomonas tetramitiformis TaxID=36881 RepID=A0AAE0FDN9_9CHLO|nr:hypothetical protein CYMTET_33154 [Cymbomonas tetramitiformis]